MKNAVLRIRPPIVTNVLAYLTKVMLEQIIQMKGITKYKLTMISESAICKKFLGQI